MSCHRPGSTWMRSAVAVVVATGCGTSAGSTSAETSTGSTGLVEPADAADSAETSSAAVPETDTGSETDGSTDAGTSAGTDTTHGAGRCPGPTIPRGGPIVVDGVVSPGEWDDAAALSVTATPQWTTDVWIKHDGESVAFAFTNIQPPRPPPAFAFPELLIDVGNDKASQWDRSDHWFHVSLTDCMATGGYDDYDGCVPEGEGWEANNAPQGTVSDTVEIRIGLELLAIDAGEAPELGLALRLSDTQGFATHWPERADPDDPSTWSTMQLCP